MFTKLRTAQWHCVDIWIGHILRRNCLLKQVTEGKIKGEIKVTRRGRRRKKLLDDLKDRRGYSHLKEEALDRAMWRNRFGGGVGSVARQITDWMNYVYLSWSPGELNETLHLRSATSLSQSWVIYEVEVFKTSWVPEERGNPVPRTATVLPSHVGVHTRLDRAVKNPLPTADFVNFSHNYGC